MANTGKRSEPKKTSFLPLRCATMKGAPKHCRHELVQNDASHILNDLSCLKKKKNCISLSRAGCTGHLTWVKHSSRKSSATHSYQCVQYFPVSKDWSDCQCLGFLTCTQMLMHAIAHGGCTDTVRESALKADSGRKVPCRTRELSLGQYCTWIFSWMLYQLNYSTPAQD